MALQSFRSSSSKARNVVSSRRQELCLPFASSDRGMGMKQKYSTETVELRSNVPPIRSMRMKNQSKHSREAATPLLGVQQRSTPHFFAHIKFLRQSHAPLGRSSEAPLSRGESREAKSHQESFSANWICLEVVFVKVIAPPKGIRVPCGLMTARLSLGEVKFARLMILKKSTRNCALKVSEISHHWNVFG
jgi:hypothetical protein